MSLIIKGLNMPKLNEKEEHLWVPGWIEVGKDGKAVFCTGTHFDPNTIRSYAIEEVPVHGRLIDRDKLIQSFLPIMEFPEDERIMYVDSFIRALKNAPTVIEAEVIE